jgi:hypothetical protein
MIGDQLWDLDDLVKKYSNFRKIERVQPDKPQVKIAAQVEEGGIPIIIENYHGNNAWQSDLLSIDWVEGNLGCMCLASQMIKFQ